MDLHGLDDPTADVHAMYTPDSHPTGVGTNPIDSGHSDLESHDGTGADTASPADPEGVELDVDGHSSEVTATIDTDHDGRADTAVISSDGGTQVAITDSDHDGVADRALLIDDHGRVVDSARFDESTGHWHSSGAAHDGAAPQDGTAADGGAQPSSPVATGSDVATGATSPDEGGSTAQIEFDAGGRRATVVATVDTDHDGRADTAIIDGGESGTVAVTDTDDDGHADEAALIGDGHVVDTAHVDPRTGQWVRGDDGHSPYTVGESVPEAGGSTGGGPSDGIPDDAGGGPPTTAGGDDTGGSDTTAGTTTGGSDADPSDAGDSTTTASDGPSHGREQPITVDAGGRTSTIQATVDANHDGVNETAVVQGVDGTRVEFSDTDGDGEADHATVIDPHGNVVGTARYDPISGEWSDTPSA